jgi:hypothetical protein
MSDELSGLLKIAKNENERLTRFKAVISSDHAYIHRGIAFSFLGNTGSLAAGATYSISFKTPANRTSHFRPVGFYATANAMELRIAEKSTVTGGTAGTPINRNRVSPQNPFVTISIGITLSAEGSVVDAFYAGTQGAGSSGTGGLGVPADEEMVLLRDETYSIRIANIGATTASTGYFRLFWYEED